MTATELAVFGPIITMDPACPRAEAMLIRDERIAAIGSRDSVRAAASREAEKVELAEGAVVPGLIDSHNHMLWTAMQTELLDLSGSRSIAEVQSRVRRHGEQHPSAEWIVSSEGWHVDALAERRYPTRDELDEACPDRPVYLPRVAHAAATNSAALRVAGIDEAAPDVAGGIVVREEATGRPTGVLLEAPAFGLVARHAPRPSEQERLQALREVQARYHELGITGVIEPGLTEEEMTLYEHLRVEDGGLTVRTVMMPLVDTTCRSAELVRWLSGLESRTGDGDEWLKTGALKLFLDGGASLGTALLREPYPEEPENRGVQVTSTATLRDIARAAASAGWSLGVHAVGGAAIDLVLSAFEEVDRDRPISDLRFSVIHAYLWPSRDNIATAARLGVVAAVQPPMQHEFAPLLSRRWGADGAARATPLRAWLDGGVTVAGGSDSPLTSPDPALGIWHAVTREVEGHGVVGPGQRITPQEALELYTRAAAFLSFAEHERGVLRTGLLGDWVALNVDPLVASSDELRDAKAVMTCVGGQIVHAAQ